MIDTLLTRHLATGSVDYVGSMWISGCTAYLTLRPHHDDPTTPEMTVKTAKLSFRLIDEKGTPLLQLDNDHPIPVSGGSFNGLHLHEFVSGSTLRRVPLTGITTIIEAGTTIDLLLGSIFSH